MNPSRVHVSVVGVLLLPPFFGIVFRCPRLLGQLSERKKKRTFRFFFRPDLVVSSKQFSLYDYPPDKFTDFSIFSIS